MAGTKGLSAKDKALELLNKFADANTRILPDKTDRATAFNSAIILCDEMLSEMASYRLQSGHEYYQQVKTEIQNLR